MINEKQVKYALKHAEKSLEDLKNKIQKETIPTELVKLGRSLIEVSSIIYTHIYSLTVKDKNDMEIDPKIDNRISNYLKK